MLDTTRPREDRGALDTARLDFSAQEIELAAEPAGFALHAVLDGEVISHVQPVDQRT